MNFKENKYKFFLLTIFIVSFSLSAYNPVSLQWWFLENILVFLFFVLLMVFSYYVKLSNISCTLILFFMLLHQIWSYYSYDVPFWYTLWELFGSKSFYGGDWYRNMYDRLVHFCYGFFLYYPFREFYMKLSKVKWFWGYYIPVQSIMAASAVYELLEWGTVMVVNPEAWMAFLWSQGDVWDAQKDMALAIFWAMISATFLMFFKILFKKKLKEIKAWVG